MGEAILAAQSLVEDRVKISARGLHYQELNRQVRRHVDQGVREIEIDGVNGQRYIGGGIKNAHVRISIRGVPGNDLASFMEGPEIEVWGNAQDGVGNTMSAGTVIIHGQAGDIVGHSMRGGRIYVQGHAGYRIGIHMKAYQDRFPVIIIGGRAGDFLGEYMAGGLIIVLGLSVAEASGRPGSVASNDIASATAAAPGWPPDGLWSWRYRSIAGNFIGTGMHGGVIYLRGEVEPHQLGKEVRAVRAISDQQLLRPYLEDFCCRLYPDLNAEELLAGTWTKLVPTTSRPYGRLYAY